MTNETEHGFTLIEVTITAVILLFVMTGLLGLLESQTKSDRTVQNIVATQEDVRLAATAMARDIRAGTLDPSPSQTPTTEIDLNVYDTPASTTATPVKWLLDTSSSPIKLIRQAKVGGSWTTTYSLSGVSTTVLFTYLSPKGTDMLANGYPLPVTIPCTQRVSVDLAAPTGATSSSVFDEKAEISLRNSTTDPNRCP